jgi:predicted GNAT family N-acyltransferase
MKSNILESCHIEIKEPVECSENEIREFHELVIKGEKVNPVGLLNRIKNCELLAFCYFEDELVGVSSIKKPNVNYVEDIIYKTRIDRNPAELKFEIGYSVTEPKVRQNGISRELKKYLLEKMKSRNGIIFSTTAIKSSQNFLEENGFEKKGNAYDGENDKGITYYEKRI